MANVLVLMAALLSGAAIAISTLTENTWRNLGYTWGLLVLSIIAFGIALTL
jgi:ABC-type transport system involved in multi-copper enzyme maturation permease subunit